MPKRNLLPSSSRAAKDPFIRAASEMYSREREALKVYRPGNDKQERIHTSPAHRLIVDGGNRSGKSTCAYMEFASRVLGVRLRDRQGREIPARFPVPGREDTQLFWIIGFDLDHIGQTIYRIMFEPNLFRVIYNSDRDEWETFNETNPLHAGRESEAVPVEPLIPGRFIDEASWSWNSAGGGRAANCFESVRLKNGSKIFAYPSSARQPKQGDPVSGLLIDEDLEYPAYAEEYLQRLIDRQGWFMWAAWPHDENYVLSNLIDKCELAAEEGDTRFERVQLSMSDNPFFTTEKKKLALDTLQAIGEEELVSRRDTGERSFVGRKMYDFLPGVQGISSATYLRALPEYDPRTPRGALQHIYRTLGKFPDAWTRYLALDPSHTRSAVAFGVVPPPEVGGVKIPPTLIVEDEVVLKKASPEHLAMAVREKAGNRNYEAFVIDRRFGQQTHAAVGMQTWTVYAEAFKKHGLRSRLTQEWFVPGCDVPLDRANIVRRMLSGEMSGGYCLYIVLDTTQQMQKEFQKYLKNKVDKGGLSVYEDVAAPRDRQRLDLMAALEYLSAYVYQLIQSGQHYVPPHEYASGKDGMESLAKRLMGGGEASDRYIHLGPGISASAA